MIPAVSPPRRLLLAVLAAAAMAGASARAAPPAPAYDIGPPVGAPIPAFHASDAAGAARTLRSVSGPKGVVLVFFRSAKWCPYCQAHLLQLKAAEEPLRRRGYGLAAISYDPPAVLSEFAARREIGYVLLSDEGSRTIDAFRLRDPQYAPGSFAYGVPEPAIFVVGPDGVIRAKLAEQGYKHRPSNEAVLDVVDALGR